MTMTTPNVPAPQGYESLVAQVREQLGSSLGALLMFGSCLSETTRQPGSVPDLLALVDDLLEALERLGCGPLTRALAPCLPPLTLALRSRAGAGETLAKLNLLELAAAQRAVRELPDLYVAGRLSKPTASLWQRDARWQAATAELLRESAAAVAELTLRGLRGPTTLDASAVVLLYIGQSYLAEVRPEGPRKWRALQHAFPSFYQDQVLPLLVARAAALGLRPQRSPTNAAEVVAFVDERTPTRRRADHRLHARLLRRSRLRTLARWPKMMLVYRGWAPYVLGKLRRVFQPQLPPKPR